MHKLMAGSTILEHELSELRLLVERQTGLMLDCPNSALAAHVIEYLEAHELDAAAALLERLRPSDQDAAVLPQFLEGLLNANTGFFRHPTAMNALTHQVLPQLFTRKSGEVPGTLRIWSAGCATGEEPYSIAMAISDALLASSTNGTANGNTANGKEKDKDKDRDRERNGAARNGGIADVPSSVSGQLGPQLSRDWSIHIVGSDLLPSAIQTAERGLYPQSALAGLPPAIIRASFSKIASANAAQKLNGSNGSGSNGNGSKAYGLNGSGVNGNGSNGERSNGTSFPASFKNDSGSDGATAASHLLVKPRLRSMITFNVMNLVRAVYIGRFDCIFCMDVLPHLSRAQRTALVERLHLYLEPGGYLFLSQTEKLCAPNLNFRSETYDGYTFHRKPLAASAAYGR
jgi:chemotaxis methyl-accepting protein methylase